MVEITSYLRKLKFDPKLLNTPVGRYLQNPRLVFLIISVSVIFGIISFLSLPRVLNPKINIAIVTVVTTLPGADPSGVETLVTIPIEQAVGNIPNIDTMTSTSQNSVSVVTLQFLSGVDPDQAENKVQTAVQSVSNLPKDATTPKVSKVDFENQPLYIFSVTGPDFASVVRFSRILRDGLKNVSSVDRVDATGLDTQEIQVLIKPETIAEYGVNPVTLSQTITAATSSQPAGTIDTQNSSFSLAIDPTVTSVDDLRNLPISINGTSVSLSDIAYVTLKDAPGATNVYVADKSHDAIPAVTFSVFKKSSVNISTADQDIHADVDKFAKQYHGQVSVSPILDTGDQVTRQFDELVRDLVITFFLVFVVILIFLGIRQAIIAAAAIPLTFLITFIVMHAESIDLSFISFFSLLLALGLLVDDTVVVISALSSYFRTGKFTPLQAGLLVWRDFKTAILTTTLTTVWAFVPLLLSTGIIGEFIKPIPIVVSTSLLASFGVAMFVTLPLVIILLKPQIPFRVTVLFRILVIVSLLFLTVFVSPKNGLLLPIVILYFLLIFIYFQTKTILPGRIQEIYSLRFGKRKRNMQRVGLRHYLTHGIINFETISIRYRRVLFSILSKKENRRKTILAVIIFSIFSYLLLPLGFVRNEFFPASSQESFNISLELPAGSNKKQTDQDAVQIANMVRSLPEVKLVEVEPGSGPETGGFGPSTSGDNTANITVVLPPTSQQTISSIDLAQTVRRLFASYPQGKVSVVEQTGGPPAGSDVQIKLFGDDLTVLDNYANKLEDYLKKKPGVTNVDKSIKPGTSKIVFVPDYQKMNDANLSLGQIGLWLRTYASGFTLDSNTKLEQGNSQGQDIVFRTSSMPETANALNTLMIPTQNGPMSLLAFGKTELRVNPTQITRDGGKRTISVTAGVTKGFSVSQKNAELEKYADSLNLPDGYYWKTGGVNQQNQDSVNSIFQAMILSFLLIIVTMVLQFTSFRKATIVMLVIPLSISGVFIVFAITHTPLSFPALIGILALFGIVVKNSILVVDKINQNLKAGIPFVHAIVDASESRLEPIALTSMTAILGLVPVTLSNALWQGLGGAIIAGLLFSGSIMLFFIPLVYYFIFVGSEGKRVQIRKK